ncbi:MAG TPA: TraB/GumN family protein [Ignavibacteriaceae bacterium]|nr:TraB/GumN family protein [Ignavibacteriaceae bacterium]
MIKKLLNTAKILFILLTASTVFLQAQDSSSFFWEISGNGLEKPSYLFGTVHLIAQSDLILPDTLESLFKSCGEIVLEVDMDDPELITKTQKLMLMPDKNIKQLLNPDEYKTLEKFFSDSLGLQLEQFGKLKPLFLEQFIIPKMINGPMASYEIKFVQMAAKYKKELTGLETVEEEVGSIDKIPYKKQADLLLETVDEFKEDRILYSQIIDAYKKMDFKNLYEMMFKMSKEFKEFEQLLLIDRNKIWVPRIENMIKEKSCFIAVGALHLEGENGLVALLKSEGYKLKPVKEK